MNNNFLSIHNFSSHQTAELYMTFSLAKKKYALPATQIVEIIQLPALYAVERLPSHIIGLLNLRGNIISVVDIRKILGITQSPFTVDHQILIININGNLVGLVSDSVCDVIPVDGNEIQELPYKTEDRYISGVVKGDNQLVAVLNLDSIFKDFDAFDFSHLNSIELESSVAEPALELFPDDELSLEKLKKRAFNLQNELKVDLGKNDYDQNRFVSFSLNNEIFCISLKFVKEFCKLKMLALTPVPCVPEFIMGLVNFRGDFITIVDVKSFLNIRKTNLTDKSKIIVLKSPNLKVGLIVDEVFDIVNIPAEMISRSGNIKYERSNYCMAEVIRNDGTVMSILDLESLIVDEKFYVEDAI